MSVEVTFHGAAGTVTGSCYLLSVGRHRLLIDCGLFQGDKTLRELNYGSLPFNPKQLNAVLLTHAHIDHSGQLPRLAKFGYAGPVHCTEASADLLRWVLPDSAMIQENEVDRLNRRNQRRGRDAVEPIYDADDAEALLQLLQPQPLNSWFEVVPGVRARLWPAGHILGSASIELEIREDESADPATSEPLRMLFSGDIGPEHKALQPPAQAPKDLDYVIMESTYGGRSRPKLDARQRQAILAEEVRTALGNGGNLLIPAFAIERTQELLADLCALMDAGSVPKAPIFVDSPLATRITRVFEQHRQEAGLANGLPAGPDPFKHAGLRYLESAEQSKQIEAITAGAIIIAASGMCDAGRIRHHLRNNLWRANATVLLIGYQAPGTLGSLLERGEKRVRIHGEEIAVHAHIRKLEVYSGHADHDELLDWLHDRLPVRGALFLTHGEADASAALRLAIVQKHMDIAAIQLPRLDETWRLDKGKPRLRKAPDKPARLDAEHRREALSGRDWHNDYAALVLGLQKRLQESGNDRQRRRLLKRLQGMLERE